jgi:hypothetical protein
MYGRVSRITRPFPESSGYNIETAEFALRSSSTKQIWFCSGWAIQHVIEPYDGSHMMNMTQRKTRLSLSLRTYTSCEPDNSMFTTTNTGIRTKDTIVNILNHRILPLPSILRCMPHIQEIGTGTGTCADKMGLLEPPFRVMYCCGRNIPIGNGWNGQTYQPPI